MLRIAILVLTLAFSACDKPAKSVPTQSTSDAGIDSLFNIQQGNKLTYLKIAGTDLEKSRGLMGVAKLPADTGSLHVIQMDVTNQELVDAARDYVERNLTDLDGLWGLVNNAGIGYGTFIEWLPMDYYERVNSY